MTEFESVITRGMTPISEERRERAVLVGVDRPGSTWPLASSLAELERLVDTAGADAVATTTQKLRVRSWARARPKKWPSLRAPTRPTSSCSTTS